VRVVRGHCFDGGMTVRWQSIVVNTTDPGRLATFWEQVLGWRRTHDSPEEVVLEPPAGSPEDGVSPDLVFGVVPEEKSVVNRLHIDLRPDDQAAEVERVLGLGATYADVGQGDDVSWVVMADLDGNEFCVLRAFTPEELAEQGSQAGNSS
jgi:predicted enzyme related to lactoylglutathione lyase